MAIGEQEDGAVGLGVIMAKSRLHSSWVRK